MTDPGSRIASCDLEFAGLRRGDASKGEMEVSDGETDCAGCREIMPAGAAIYWMCSTEMECDPYCTACARETVVNHQRECEAIEADFHAGRLT